MKAKKTPVYRVPPTVQALNQMERDLEKDLDKIQKQESMIAIRVLQVWMMSRGPLFGHELMFLA